MNNTIRKNNQLLRYRYYKDLRSNPKPRVSPDRTETGPGSGNIFKNIFGSGRVGGVLFRVGPGRGIFYRGMRHFILGFRDKLES